MATRLSIMAAVCAASCTYEARSIDDRLCMDCNRADAVKTGSDGAQPGDWVGGDLVGGDLTMSSGDAIRGDAYGSDTPLPADPYTGADSGRGDPAVAPTDPGPGDTSTPGSCATGSDDNATEAMARDLGTVVVGTAFCDDLDQSEVDWLRFTVRAGRIIHLNVDTDLANVFITDCNGNSIGWCQPEMLGSETDCAVTNDTNGSADFCANLSTAQVSSFDYNLTLVEVTTCFNDATENDDFDFDASLYPGMLASGTLCPGDPDWYEFTADASDGITYATITFDPTFMQFVAPEVTDCAGTDQQVECFTNTAAPPAVMGCSMPALGPGSNYCFGVAGEMPLGPGPSAFSYDLELFADHPCGDDSTEFNDIPDDATPVLSSGTVLTNRQLCAIDRDWYELSAQATASSFTVEWPVVGPDQLEWAVYTNCNSTPTLVHTCNTPAATMSGIVLSCAFATVPGTDYCIDVYYFGPGSTSSVTYEVRTP